MAYARAFRATGSLDEVVRAMRFVQFDPIRRPAMAQDLLLFQRVDGYRAGDLTAAHPIAGFEEDSIHVYGLLDPDLRALAHPRPHRETGKPYRPDGLAAAVLEVVRELGRAPTADVAARFEKETVVNPWGGQSAATTQALGELQFHGLIRVSERVGGIKVFEPAEPPAPHGLDDQTRLDRLAWFLFETMAPVAPSALRAVVNQTKRHCYLDASVAKALDSVRAKAIELTVDGVLYLYLPGDRPAMPVSQPAAETNPAAVPGPPKAGHQPDLDAIRERAAALAAARPVRIVAPFDALVWDRPRFAHLWGWEYRFEAYFPAAKRKFGYYALPVMYRQEAIGWVNASVDKTGLMEIDAQFVGTPPKTKVFQRAFDAECTRLATMVGAVNGWRTTSA